MFFFSYCAGAFAVLCFLFICFVLYHRKRNALASYLCLVVLGSGLWAFSNAAADLSMAKSAGVFWSGTAVVSFLFLTASFMVFVAHFIDQNGTLSRFKLFLYYLPSAVLSLFAFSQWSTVDIVILHTQPSQTIVGPLYIICLIFLYIAFFFSYYRLFTHYPRFTRRAQLQAIYITLGSIVMLASVTVFDIVLPLRGELRFFSVGPLSTGVMIAALTYAIFRHQLLDIRVVIQRSLIYATLLVLLIGCYLSLVLILGVVFEKTARLTILTAAGLSTLLGIFGAPVLERRFRKATDRFFFKDRYDYSETLEKLTEILARNIERDAFLKLAFET